MKLDTIWTLNYGDDGSVVNVGEKIKVSLSNGEILIGEYRSSDWTSLQLERDNNDMDIDFDEITNLVVLSE